MAGLPWIKVHTDLPRDPRSLHLADLLADARAWTYVLQMRLYLAEHAAAGTVSGLGAVATVERSAGWMGERGRLVDAMRDAGFVRAGPARDGRGTEVVDLDWLAEQGAHVEKFVRDAKKPRGNSRKVVSPSRDIGGTRAGPSLTPRGESRELKGESREEATTFPPASRSAPEQATLLPEVTPGKARKPKAVPAQPPGDPRHKPLLDALFAAGWSLGGTGHAGRGAKAVKDLLALADEREATRGERAELEVLRRAASARAHTGFPAVRELWELVAHWSHFGCSAVDVHLQNPNIRGDDWVTA